MHIPYYKVSGTNNSTDLEKIKSALLKHPYVKAVETTSKPPMVSITVEIHPDQASLQNAVWQAGDFTITEQSEKQGNDHSAHRHSARTKPVPDNNFRFMHKDEMNRSKTDHRNMKHDEAPSPTLTNKIESAVVTVDHSQMDHSKMDHSEMKTHQGGHAAHGGHNHAAMITDFKRRFFVVLALTLPIILLSPMIQQWLGVQWQFPGAIYILFGLSTIVFFYGGWPFLKGWFEEMKNWKPGMMTLIGFAITVAYVYSVATVFGLAGMDFFWELTTLILIMLLGHWIEMKSKIPERYQRFFLIKQER